jgi:SpoVK/Ycf46/Vps4 family AAA+-type ATPase
MNKVGASRSYFCFVQPTLTPTSSSVIRPRLPLDILGGSVGDSEDSLVSIFGTLSCNQGRSVVLLDDVGHLFAGNGDDEYHSKTRSQSMLLTLLDSLEELDCRPVLVIAFSSFASEALMSRFGFAFHLDAPQENERRALLTRLLSVPDNLSENNQKDQVQVLLATIVEATVGKSYAELNQLCRQVLEAEASTQQCQPLDFLVRLQTLHSKLSASIPASLRNAFVDDVIDMRILTAKDLLAIGPEHGPCFDGELKGDSAKKAWSELVGFIILPLCRSSEFHELMDRSCTGSHQRSTCGGVLLTGAPMSGKSFIAYQCSRYAASLRSTIKVLDVSCTSLVHKEVGGSERAVRRLFDCARKAAPCILIMDAIENVAAVRGHDTTTEGTLDRILSTLLVELDGVEDHDVRVDAGIAVIGITHDSSLVDSALLRPGRLGRIIELRRDW